MRRRDFMGLMGRGAAGLLAANMHGAEAQANVRRVGALITTPTAKDVLEKTLTQLGLEIGRKSSGRLPDDRRRD